MVVCSIYQHITIYIYIIYYPNGLQRYTYRPIFQEKKPIRL